MNFEYLKPTTLEAAFQALKQYEHVKPYAGGTDLLWQIRGEAVEVECLVDLKAIPGMGYIRDTGDRVEIGPLATLREIENSSLLQKEFPALTEAARTVASQKLRNKATLAGNLCQRVKCPYFNQSHINLYMRESLAPCFKRKGKVCHAVVYGDDVLHTITGKSYCKAPVPSDTAIALSALGAVIEVSTENGVREVPAHSFYRGDGEANIKPNEIVTKIVLPRKAGHGSAFRCYKPGPGCFAVVSAAAALTLDEDGKTCGGLELYLGGVAQKPYLAAELVEPLLHRELTGDGISQVTQSLFRDVEITNDDVLFKVAKARALCREALMQAWSRAQGGN